MNQENTKIVISPVDHFTGARHSRRTWSAAVTLTADEAVRQECGHHGHPTTDSAKACAMKLWRRLPKVA